MALRTRCNWPRPEYRAATSSRGWQVSSSRLQNVARQILVFHDVRQHFSNIVRVHCNLLAFFLRRLEAEFIEHALHDGVQAAGSDIFRALVYTEGEVSNFIQCLWSELELHAFGFEQSSVLLDQRRLRLGEDAD